MSAMRATSPPPAASCDGFSALDACHHKTLDLLDELSRLIAQLGQGQPDAAMRASAARIALHFSTTAREHHEDEERHVFPAVVALGQPGMVEAVLRLQQDHDRLEEEWFDLAPQVQALAAGRRCDVPALRDGAAALAALYHDHIALEESFIYPQAQGAMPAAGRRDMGREMAARHRAERAARRLPQGSLGSRT
jgi:hemerythrin-like domain-containing protein